MHSSRRLFLAGLLAAILVARLTAVRAGPGRRLAPTEPVSEAAVRSAMVAEFGLIVELWHEVHAAGMPIDAVRVADVARQLEALHGQAGSGNERQELTRMLARANKLLADARADMSPRTPSRFT
jgi:hypothetical protein